MEEEEGSGKGCFPSHVSRLVRIFSPVIRRSAFIPLVGLSFPTLPELCAAGGVAFHVSHTHTHTPSPALGAQPTGHPGAVSSPSLEVCDFSSSRLSVGICESDHSDGPCSMVPVRRTGSWGCVTCATPRTALAPLNHCLCQWPCHLSSPAGEGVCRQIQTLCPGSFPS